MCKNRFDSYYDIRLATVEEIPAVMDFIGQYWKKGHILSRNREFFEYEMVIDGVVNFVVAVVKTTGEIDGILGFLPCSNRKDKLDAWGVIWKTKNDALPMLGIELKKRFCAITGVRNDLGVGANVETSVPLLGRILHFYTAKMKHFYRLCDKASYTVAKVAHKDIVSYTPSNGLEIIALPMAEDLENFFDFPENALPYKNFWYYNRRFYNHPIYKYQLWGAFDGKTKAIFVTRVQQCQDTAIISIVDYAGEATLFSQCGSFFDKILKDNGYEFIDFYFDGFPEEYVKSAGFVELEKDDTNIIPTYFNPFVLSNVDIYVDASNKKDKFTFFKADGDQDRPN